jgi:hypothetical protein
VHALVVPDHVVVDDAGERRREADRVDRVEGAGLVVRAEVDAGEPVALDDQLGEGLESSPAIRVSTLGRGSRPCRSRRCS